MNRRNFLRGLFGVAAVAAAAPVMKFIPEIPPTAPVLTAHIDQFADYIAISDLAVGGAIDPIIAEAAKQLAYRAQLTMIALYLDQFDASLSFDGRNLDGRQLARFNRAVRRERYRARQYRRRARAACIQR